MKNIYNKTTCLTIILFTLILFGSGTMNANDGLHYDYFENSENNNGKTLNSSENYKMIKWSPGRIIGISSPGIELSYEQRFQPRMSTQVTAAYLYPKNFLFKNGNNDNASGYRITLEQKYSLEKHEKFGHYVSFEVVHFYKSYDITSTFIESEVLVPYDSLYFYNTYNDSYRIKKRNWAFQIKFGYQRAIGNFCFDVFAGIGLKHKNVKHYDRVNPNHIFESYYAPSNFHNEHERGKYWHVNIPLNFKIGWLIN